MNTLKDIYYSGMDSDNRAAASNKKSTIHRFDWSEHWPLALLIGIIVTVSTAVALIMLPYLLQEENPLDYPDLVFCSSTPYTGSVCLEELQEWQSFLPERENVSDNVFIPSDVDQELSETRAELLFAGLQLAGTSQECEREFKSFWCLLLFGVCDGSGGRRLPSSDQCSRLQTDTCSEIIQIAATVPEYSAIVQNCNNFRFNTPIFGNESDGGSRKDFNVSCSDDFFYDESSLLCKPKCGVWTQLTPDADNAILILSIMGNIASIMICITIVVLSIIQYKKIFTFPAVLMIYPTVAVFIASLFDIVSHVVPEDSYLCPSEDLLQNIVNGSATPFCKVQAGILIYVPLMTSLFWLFQSAIYFWVVIYPVNYRSFKSTGKLKFIHVMAVVISFLLPVVPLVAVKFDGGIGISFILRRKCSPLSPDFIFYGVIAPVDLIVIFGISLLIITVWSIGNVKKRLQKKPLQERTRLKSAEVKLIVMIVHYLIVGLYTVLSTNVILRNIPDHGQVLVHHFTCEAFGDETVSCSREGFNKLNQDGFIQTFVYLGYNLYPSVFLIFLISPKACVKRRREFTEPTVAPSQAD